MKKTIREVLLSQHPTADVKLDHLRAHFIGQLKAQKEKRINLSIWSRFSTWHLFKNWEVSAWRGLAIAWLFIIVVNGLVFRGPKRIKNFPSAHAMSLVLMHDPNLLYENENERDTSLEAEPSSELPINLPPRSSRPVRKLFFC